MSECAVNLVEQPLAETARQPVARKGQIIPDGMHAHSRERGDGVRGLVEEPQPQRRQRAPQFVTVADASGDAGAGEQQRAGGGGRDGNHSVIAQLPEIGADAPAKLAQSAEQPEAAADFEQHFVAGGDAHRGRELSRP